MPVFGIMHTIKLKVSNTMGVQLENNRTKLDCNRNFAGSQIEWDRTDENLHWVHSGNWDKSAYELCQKYDVPKVKKDSVIALQTVYTASRDWFTQDENGNIIFDEKAESFFRDCMKFHIENYCGGREDLLINCTSSILMNFIQMNGAVYQDGTGAIHMHCTSVPIVENEKGEFVLSAKRVMGHRKEMTQAQQRFHDNVCKSRGMERGMSSNETKRKHLDNLTYQAQQEEKKLQKAQEAREEVQKGTKAQEVDLAVARANERIKKSTEEAFASTVQGYTSVVPESTTINLQNGRARYALYPVWILNTQWNGQKFTFGINGQTGKIAGDLPMDKNAFWSWLFGVAGAAAAAVFALSYLLWLL